MECFQELLERTAVRHYHLCPRQVLGVRIGMLAGKALNIVLPQSDKRVFAFTECDGCGMGGIAIASGCFVERRTLRVMDFGKLAATFVDLENGNAVRITPKLDIRSKFNQLGLSDEERWQAMLDGYKILPDEELLACQPVKLTISLEAIISRPGLRVLCDECGEEITNEREVLLPDRTLCRSCAGEGYYKAAITANAYRA